MIVSAAATLVLTSTVPGVCQRKSPTSHSLVHTLVAVLTREQHALVVSTKALLLLSHSCQAQECRTVIVKVVHNRIHMNCGSINNTKK